jgi:hypothetical protein
MAEFKKEIERLTERIAAERWRVSKPNGWPQNFKGVKGATLKTYRLRSAAPLPQCALVHARASRPNRDEAPAILGYWR